VSCGAPKASEIPELAVIKDLHLRLCFAFLFAHLWLGCAALHPLALIVPLFCSALRTIDELGLDRSVVSGMMLFLCSYPKQKSCPLALLGMFLLAIQRVVVLFDVQKAFSAQFE